MYHMIRKNEQPLSDDQIRALAPSVFAVEAHESRSDRYTYIPTSDILAGMRSEGFLPFAASQSRCRIAGKSDYTRHMLRFRRAGNVDAVVGAEVPEVILVNSHDGTSSYQLDAGMYRFVCANGMVVSTSSIESVRVHHKGNIRDNVIEGAYRVVSGFDNLLASVDSMRAVELAPPEQQALATAASLVRWGETAPVTADTLLRPLRREDTSNDLWTTFNRIQEHTVRGGDRGRAANGARRRTREVTGITQSVSLNKALWSLAEEMKRLKAA